MAQEPGGVEPILRVRGALVVSTKGLSRFANRTGVIFHRKAVAQSHASISALNASRAKTQG